MHVENAVRYIGLNTVPRKVRNELFGSIKYCKWFRY